MDEQQSDLIDLTAFFFPRAVADAFMKKTCTEDYRTGSEAVHTMEKEIPGILDRMVEAETEYCDRNLEPFLDVSLDKIKSGWTHALSPADLSHLAMLLRQAAQIETEPGNTQTVVSGIAVSNNQARTGEALKALMKTPHEAALLKKAAAYKIQVKSDFASASNDFFRAARLASMRAANAYAASAGYDAVYDVPPSGPAS